MFWNCGVGENSLESLCSAWRFNQSILKETSPEYSLEGLMLKLRLWPPDVKNWLIAKEPDARKYWRQEEKGTTEEMVGWHHQLDGLSKLRELMMDREAWHPWGWPHAVHVLAESDMTGWLNWTEQMILVYLMFVRHEGLVISIQDLKVCYKLRKFESFPKFAGFISAFFLLMLCFAHMAFTQL